MTQLEMARDHFMAGGLLQYYYALQHCWLWFKHDILKIK
jgi:hypothetical protein